MSAPKNDQPSASSQHESPSLAVGEESPSATAADAEAGVAQEPSVEAASEAATPRLPDEIDLTVRRQVNLRTFMILGALVGVIAAVVLTYAFPESTKPITQELVTHGQVFGFLLVFLTALSTLLFCGIALIINAIIGRRRGTAKVRRVK